MKLPTPPRELVCPQCGGRCVSRHAGFCFCTTCRWQGRVIETMEYRYVVE